MTTTSPIVVYSLTKIPLSYMGELVSTQPLVIKRVLTLLMDPRQGEERVTITAVPFASRESTITVNTEDLPGILISEPEEDLLQHYKREIIGAYSKLNLVKGL